MNIDIGDVVMINSGVCPMTVVDYSDDTITCQWLNYRGEKNENEFNINMIFNPELNMDTK